MHRREVLLARISGQREQLADIAVRLQTPLMFADRALLAVRFVRAHPLLLAGFTGLMMIRRHSLSGLFSGSWRLWRAYRYISNVARKSS